MSLLRRRAQHFSSASPLDFEIHTLPLIRGVVMSRTVFSASLPGNRHSYGPNREGQQPR